MQLSNFSLKVEIYLQIGSFLAVMKMLDEYGLAHFDTLILSRWNLNCSRNDKFEHWESCSRYLYSIGLISNSTVLLVDITFLVTFPSNYWLWKITILKNRSMTSQGTIMCISRLLCKTLIWLFADCLYKLKCFFWKLSSIAIFLVWWIQ